MSHYLRAQAPIRNFRRKSEGRVSDVPDPGPNRPTVPTLVNLGFDKLVDPPTAELDICFVHGLTGDRITTWTSETDNGDQSFFWPEFLARDFPQARVLTYGHNADVVRMLKDPEDNGLQPFGEKLLLEFYDLRFRKPFRPVVFIAHGLGGLVVEDALIQSMEHREVSLGNLVTSTIGVVFFGTPHESSYLAEWGVVLAKLLQTHTSRDTADKLAYPLKRTSRVFSNVAQKFQREIESGKLEHIKLCCCYEQRATPGIGYIVTKDAAIMPGHDAYCIDADHRTMVKPDGEYDKSIVPIVKDHLEAWLERTMTTEQIAVDMASSPPMVSHPLDLPLGVASELSEQLGIFIRDGNVLSVQIHLERKGLELARGGYAWLRELLELGYSCEDIAEVLVEEYLESPWITYHPQKLDHYPDMEFHQVSCVHQRIGAQEPASSTDLLAAPRNVKLRGLDINEAEEPMPLADEPTLINDRSQPPEIKRMIEELCGLAGIRPTSENMDVCKRAVRFSGDDLSKATIRSLDIDESLAVVQALLEQIDLAMTVLGWLQVQGLCCNVFTILIQQKDAVEAIAIPFSIIEDFKSNLKQFQVNLEQSWDMTEQPWDNREQLLQVNEEQMIRLYEAMQAILDLFGAGEYPKALPSETGRYDEPLDRATLATKCICVGLLSYSIAHVGALQPFFLENPLKEVELRAWEEPKTIHLRLTRLSCLRDLLADSVLVFSCDQTRRESPQDVDISPEDFLDLWGPGRLIIDEERIVALEVGGGLVQINGAINYTAHWERGIALKPRQRQHQIFPSRKMRIGAHLDRNQNCPLDFLESLRLSNGFTNLGTSITKWEEKERQAGLQAGQYVTVQAVSTWAKRKGVTLKDLLRHTDHKWLGTSILEQLWGVQVSFCTSIAKRVPLREMLADVVCYLMGDRIYAPGWEELRDTYNLVENLRKPDFKMWIHDLPESLQHSFIDILKFFLETFHGTGVDKDAHEFVIACPPTPGRCFRIPCSNIHVWAKLLEDTDETACYAYVSGDCSVTCDVECRGLIEAPWQHKADLFGTAVCENAFSFRTKNPLAQLELEKGATYRIGKPENGLVARLIERPLAPARLALSKVTLMDRTIRLTRRLERRRLERQQKSSSFSSLRERQKNDAHFVDVYLVDGYGQ